VEIAMKAETFNALLGQIALFTVHQREQFKVCLDEQNEQQQVLDIIETPDAQHPRCCPHCQGSELYRHGRMSDLQRYRCKTCGRTFNALTGTPLAHLHMKEKWLGFSAAIQESKTLRQAAADLGVHRNTTLRWRHRFLDGLKEDRAPKLQGITEVDETYFLESHKGCRHLDRHARRRGGKACKAGLSNEQICVLVARDRNGETLDWVMGNGQMTKAQLKTELQPALSPDVLLISDGSQAIRYFAQDANISHEAVNLRAGIRVKGAIHIQNVNAYHGRLKQWMFRFHGVATHYLSNYLGWFRSLDNHHANSRRDVLAMAIGKFPQLLRT
jgi:transposase-like protein